jgi:hypothetical protein
MWTKVGRGGGGEEAGIGASTDWSRAECYDVINIFLALFIIDKKKSLANRHRKRLQK